MYAGEAVAAGLPGVSAVSNSWSGGEAINEASSDSVFTTPSGHTGVTFLAATGDEGMPAGYPAYSPNVVAVGGTQLTLNNDAYGSETGWNFPTPRTLDNGDSSYSQTGPWSSASGGFSGAYSTAAAGSASAATWTTAISPSSDEGGDGGVEVSATWVAGAGNATNATYAIYDGTAATGTLLGTVTVDQTQPPVDMSDGGTQFQGLGVYYPQSSTLTVVLSAASANGEVVADAIGIAADSAGGGGQSQVEPEPSYQLAVQNSGYRTAPDVSCDASGNSGVFVFYNGNLYDVWGTSLATPCWAALIAIANQGLVADGGTTLNSSANPTHTLQALYSLPAGDFNDITSGYNGLSAGPGYDEVTGLGSPIANLLVPDLINLASVPFSLSQSSVSVGTASILPGDTTTVTLTAREADGSQELSGGRLVTFSLAADSTGSGTFSAVTDNGNGTYSATFTGTTAGSISIAATIDRYSVTSAPPALTVLPPTVTAVSTTAAAGAYPAGTVIPITLTFNEPVTVSGTPQLALNAGGGALASYSGGSGTSALTFNYIVEAGQNSSDLDYASIAALGLNGGSIQDANGNAAILTLPATGGDGLATKNIVVDTTVPELTTLLVENGLTERSYVDQLTFEFSEPVTSTAAVPMTLTDFGTDGNLGESVALTASQFQWSTVPGTGASVLTWSLESFAGGASSLPNGYYQLTLPSGLITDQYGLPLDGDGDGQPGGNYVADFFVLQGDVNGDGVVDNNDMAIVNAALGSQPGSSNWNPNADLNREGRVVTSDRIIVYDSLGQTITPPVTQGTSVTPAVAASLPAWSFAGPAPLTTTNGLPAGTPVNGFTFTADAGSFVLDSNAVELSGSIVNQSPNPQTINLPLTLLGGNQTIDTASGNVTITGDIGQSGGSFGITKKGSGTLVLSGVNTYSGPTAVDQGTVLVTNASALPAGTSLVVGAGGVLVFDPSQAAAGASAVVSPLPLGEGQGVGATGTSAIGQTSPSLVTSGQAMPAAEEVSAATTASPSLAANPASAAGVASPGVVFAPTGGDPVIPVVVLSNLVAPTVTPAPTCRDSLQFCPTACLAAKLRPARRLCRPRKSRPNPAQPSVPRIRAMAAGNSSQPLLAQAHDAVLQSLHTRPLVEAEKAAALSDGDNSWFSGQSDSKQNSIDRAVDAVMAMLERM